MRNPEHSPKVRTEIIHWTDKDFEEQFSGSITEDYQDVAAVLSDLPGTMKIYFDDAPVNKEYPADGVAYAHDIVTLKINPLFRKSPQKIKRQLRSTIFHEVFHIRQHFSLEDGQYSALEAAVFEGCGTIFEREYTDSQPRHGTYQDLNEETLNRWYDELSHVSADEYFESSGATFAKLAFFDPATNEQWKIYRTGTWVVDQVLAARNIDVIDLQDMSASQIIEWFELVR